MEGRAHPVQSFDLRLRGATTLPRVDAEDAKELVERFYREAISGRDASACERLLSADFVHNGEPRGREGQRAAVEYFLAAFPDLEHEVLLILGEDDLVAAHQRWAGTHGGEFLGFAPTGRRVEFTSTAILRVSGGLIAEAWDELDSGAIVAQLGPSA
jgi:predicted ester cyclase